MFLAVFVSAVALFVALVVVVLTTMAAGRAVVGARERRRSLTTLTVTTYPEIELSHRYGGWDADAYDARNGRSPQPDRLVSRAFRPGHWFNRSE